MKLLMTPLKHVCEVIPGFAFKSRDLADSGIPVVKIGSISDTGSVDLDSGQFFPETLLEERHEKFFLNSGDIVLAMTGEGKVGRIRSELRCLLNQRVCRLAPLEADDQQYLWVAVRSIDYARVFAQLAQGAAQANISGGQLESLQIPWPKKRERGRIAETVSAYDDLIENNRRRMALLEEAARQLYREWFVRLRFPGHEHTRVSNGVPEGWERREFAGACASLEDGDWIETKDQGGDDYRLLQISNIGINEFVETGNYRYVTEQTFKRLNCRELLPGHILIARMPKPIGRAWLITEMPWRMITAVDAAIAVANEDLADAYFLTHYLNSPSSLEHCERRAVGATRPRIARRELSALPLLLPPRRLQTHFREFAEPLNQQRAVLFRQNEKLRAARDLLLPRLMSGEIAV